jgi:hypothetical protein
MQITRLLLAFIAISFPWRGDCSPANPPQALIVCYSADEVIEAACQEIAARLKECAAGKFFVRRIDSPTPAHLAAVLGNKKQYPFPSHMPVFVVGHGASDSEGEHFIALRKFWSEEEGPVSSEKFHDPANTVRSPKITKAIEEHLDNPAVWYMSCHSGGTCKHGRNVGATCKSWETTSLSGGKIGPFKGHRRIDQMTRRVLELLCDPEAFAAIDTEKDSSIVESEFRSQLEESFREAESCFVARADTEKEQEKVLSTITSQFGKGAEIVGKELTKKGDATLMKVEICQQDCLSGGYWGSKNFSPSLKKYALYSPALQQLPERSSDLVPHAGAPQTFPAPGRRRFLPRLRERLRHRN